MTKYFVLGILVFACACIILPMVLMNFGGGSGPVRRDPPPEPEDPESPG